MIEQSFDDLSHALRIFGEHCYRFNELALIDKDEAIGNMDIGFNGILNAFHSLYDARNQAGGIDWYSFNEFLFVAAVRNARHHNNANKIRQLYNKYWPGTEKVPRILLINPSPPEPMPIGHEYYVSLSDLDELLKQDRRINRLPANAHNRIHDYLNWEGIEAFRRSQEIVLDAVFYNAIPLIVNACKKIYPDISGHLSGKSLESRSFMCLFEDGVMSVMSKPKFDTIGGLIL
jgi:hypothetical protein